VYRCFLIVVLLLVRGTAQAETGLASHYSGRGHSGEMTCARRTRCGSIVTVTHAGHQHAVVSMIADDMFEVGSLMFRHAPPAHSA
jgi:hypothetical protein